ncbi:MAG: hypothetical protein ACYDB5_10500 [bacterium]
MLNYLSKENLVSTELSWEEKHPANWLYKPINDIAWLKPNPISIKILLQGEKNQINIDASIDTEAEISIIPLQLAINIGAWQTDKMIDIKSSNGQRMLLPLGFTYIYFPSLKDMGGKHIGGQFPIAISDIEQLPIIGMDIMKPLGISIDTKTSRLSKKDEIWEAFKILSAAGVMALAGMAILKAISEAK